MLTLYANQLTDLETELAKLTEMLEQKKQMAKALKATERKATKLVDGLKGLIEELSTDARANLRESIIALFPSSQLPATDNGGNDTPVAEPEEVLPILKAIEEVQQAKPLTAAGKLDQQQEQQPSQGQPEEVVTDIPIASSPTELENAFSQVVPLTSETGTSELQSEEQQQQQLPEAAAAAAAAAGISEDAIATADAKTEPPATAINEFCSFVFLNSTMGYIRANRGQMAGEIMSAYLGCASQKLALDWAEAITLWGARTEIRKPERLQDFAIKYEVKIWDLGMDRINSLAQNHDHPSSPVPQSESTKKPQKTSEESGEKMSSGGGETASPTSLNLTVEESSVKPENSNLETQESKFVYDRSRAYDPLLPEYVCYLREGNKYLGKVRPSLSPNHNERWVHDALRGIEWQTVSFATQEEAAEDLLRRKQYAEKIHQKINNDVRKMYGFDEIEKAEAATEDAMKKDAMERIDGYMQQLNWSKKQTKEFSITRFGIDHRSKMDLLQLLELAEAMQQQLNQPA